MQRIYVAPRIAPIHQAAIAAQRVSQAIARREARRVRLDAITHHWAMLAQPAPRPLDELEPEVWPALAIALDAAR